MEVMEPDAKRRRIQGKKQSTLFAFARRPATPLAADEQWKIASFRTEWVPKVGEDWCNALLPVLRTPSVQKTIEQVEEMRKVKRIFPPVEDVFKAFRATPLEKVRVVIVGQDPYHGCGQANGLAFSVAPNVAVPPSLINMLQEANALPTTHGNLTHWTEQGVLLLNSVLTVVEGQPNSHKSLGWERLTDAAIRAVSKDLQNVIFLLWGRDAQAKAHLVDRERHVVLTAGHPSPLSYERHFKGCGHFQKVNQLLSSRGEKEIVWSLP